MLTAIAVFVNFLSLLIGVITAQKNYHHPKRKLFENFFANRNYLRVFVILIVFVLLNWWYIRQMDKVEAENKKEYANQLQQSVLEINDSTARRFDKITTELADELRGIGYELDSASLTISKLQERVNRPIPEIKPTIELRYDLMKLTRISKDSIEYKVVVRAAAENVYNIDLKCDVLLQFKDKGTQVIVGRNENGLFAPNTNIEKGSFQTVVGNIALINYTLNHTYEDIERVYFYVQGSYKSNRGVKYSAQLMAHYDFKRGEFMGTPMPLFPDVIRRINREKN
ncbi:MAG: hypothetical protein WKF87_17830 [Chryseolinea sp.]